MLLFLEEIEKALPDLRGSHKASSIAGLALLTTLVFEGWKPWASSFVSTHGRVLHCIGSFHIPGALCRNQTLLPGVMEPFGEGFPCAALKTVIGVL